MSGSALAPWASQPRPRENAKILAKSLGCPIDDSKRALRCLQASLRLMNQAYIVILIDRFKHSTRN